MTKNKSSYQGKIVTDIETGSNHNGKVYARFTIKPEGGELVDCVVWGNYIDDRCDDRDLGKGKIVLVRGFWGQPKQGMEAQRREFVIKWYGPVETPEIQVQTWNERLYNYYGGQAKWERVRTEREEYMLKQGFVWARITEKIFGWRKKDHCIRWKGHYWDRIEFVMEILGDKEVNRRIRKFFRERGYGSVTGFLKRNQRKKDKGYGELIGNMILEAKTKQALEEEMQGVR